MFCYANLDIQYISEFLSRRSNELACRHERAVGVGGSRFVMTIKPNHIAGDG